jgi:hypothetical protein
MHRVVGENVEFLLLLPRRIAFTGRTYDVYESGAPHVT